MSLKDPSTILRAWLVAPLLVAGCSALLGVVIARASGRETGALTAPLGFLGGVVALGALMRIGLTGQTASICLAVAALGLLAWLARPLGTAKGRASAWVRRPEVLWPAASGVAGYLIAMAPLVGSGRLGVIGYVLNNDPSIHSSLVELLAKYGQPMPTIEPASSFSALATLANENYPTGGHAWSIFASTLSGQDAFFIWTPMIAVACAMLSLTAYAVLRRFGAGRAMAAIAGALLPAGFLTYSYVAQGSGKELVTAVAVYVAAAATAEVIESRAGPRALVTPGVAAAAALLSFGAGAGTWIGPLFVPLLAFWLWQLRAHRPRPRTLALAAAVLAAFAALSVPLIKDAVEYVNAADAPLRNPAQVGNLVGAVPWEQALNIWFAFDYHIDPPRWETLSHAGFWVAIVLAGLGVAMAFHRGRLAIPLAVVAGTVGAFVISGRYAIYMDAKSYMILAPAAGMATAAGIAALIAAGRWGRVVGTVTGVVVATGVLCGAYMVYAGAWISPRDRFEELAEIADRFEGGGPIFVNEREEWAYYWLRDLAGFEPWGSWQPGDPGFTADPLPRYLPHTPDFDDFRLDHVQRFPLLLERKGPGGSRAPANYQPVFETPHYRVWRRMGRAPVDRIGLGVGTLESVGPLRCDESEVASRLAAARAAGHRLVASVPATRTTLIVDPTVHWFNYAPAPVVPPPGMIGRRGGVAGPPLVLPPGRYEAWIQGSFGPGVAFRVHDREIGSVYGDLGLPQWHPLGEFTTDGSQTAAVLIPLGKPKWQSGNRRDDLTGQVVVQRPGPERRLERLSARDGRKLCGRVLDWVEIMR